MERLDHARLAAFALALAPATGLPGAAQEPALARLARDPDRGLEDALRERLLLANPVRDSYPVERWAARIEAHLEHLARLWSAGLLQELGEATWIAPGLEVAPLCAEHPDDAPASGEWSFVHAPSSGSEEPALELAGALQRWRAAFPGEARLELEVFAIDGAAPRIESQVRLTASGALPAARVQHNVVWSCAWQLVSADEEDAEPDEVELVGLTLERFESVRLAGHPQGLFEDVSESVLGPALFREEVAPGLDDWRALIPATLEPGLLGHHGLALGDADGDGLEDVYWCRPGGLPNRLFLHTADGTVRDVSAEAGVDLLDYSSSALLADLDGDLDADLLVATGTGLVFFANDGRARFEQELRLERSLPTSLAAVDYDADGDLDVYACAYVSPYEKDGMPVPYHDAENGEANVLLRNEGEWRFADVTADVGMDEANRRFSLAAGWEDFDEDGDADLFVANDFGEKNLYRNDGGRFRDVAMELGTLDVGAGMGVTWGDADLDGWMDVYVTNLYSPAGSRLTSRADFRPDAGPALVQALRDHAQGNSLLLNEKGRAFRDVSEASGTFQGRWGWGSIFVDLDGDGTLDVFAPNGFVTGERKDDLDSFFWRQVVLRSPEGPGEPGPVYAQGWRAVNRLVRQGWSWNGHERNVAFLNQGQARFADVSSATGLDFTDDARAAARVDWDGDGDEDLIVTNRTAPMLRFLRNRTVGARWIAFTLRAKDARTAVGARVELVTTSGRRLSRTLSCGEGYLAQASAGLHFGLGTDDVERVSVRWPGGEREEFAEARAGTRHLLEQGTGTARVQPARTAELRLRASAADFRVPAPSGRTALPAALALPRLALENAQGKAASLLGITLEGPRGTGKPLLLVVGSSADPGSRRQLARLAAAAELFSGTGLQVLALESAAGEARERALEELTGTGWPFSRGFAGEEALQILELVQAALHDDARSLALPSGFLVDPLGQLVATYSGTLEPDVIRDDLALFGMEPDERRAACIPLPGRWIAPPEDTLAARVAGRLAAHGLQRPAAEYELARVEVRPLSAAQRVYDRAVSAHRGGRLAEAIALYQSALASDPGFAPAAQDLAVALHQNGDRAAALAAYRNALRLDPGHALTRCNLGYLLAEQGDLAGARAELEALRSLSSELASSLEERIRALEKP